MIDEEDINFLKVFLIILKGGTLLCRKLVLALVSQNGNSLENILQGHRKALTPQTTVQRNLTNVQFEKLFPRNNQAIDINQWDISLLTFVLLNVFSGSFDSPGIAAVKTLRDKRNTILAHGYTTKMTNDEFARIWPHVTMAMRQLSRKLTHADEMEYILIESKICFQPFQTATVKELEEIKLIDTLTQNVVTSIMPKVIEEVTIKSDADHRRRNEEIFRRLEQIEKKQAEQGNKQDQQDHKIVLLARMQANTGSTSCSPQVHEEVQDHMLKATHSIISKDPGVNYSEDEVASTLDDLIKGMEDQGVKVKKVEKGSILLTILCPTTTCLGDLIVYMKSPQISYKLTQIENAVEKYHACETKIAIDIDLHSLDTAINTLEEELDVGAVYLTLECSGTWGVKNAFQMFENGESTNTLNKLSEALSHKVGEKVELYTSIDKDKLEDYIEKEIKRKGEDGRIVGEEKPDFDRTSHDAERRKEVQLQLQKDIEKMSKSDERSRQLLGDHIIIETERKEEDERTLRERQTFQTSVYEQMWKENEDDLRKLIEVRRTVEEPLEIMRKSLERSQQLLENLRGSNMPVDEFFTQLEENEPVIRRLNKELDKTSGDLELLRKRAIHRQRRRQHSKEIGKKQFKAVYKTIDLKKGTARGDDIRSAAEKQQQAGETLEKLWKSDKGSGPLLEKQHGMDKAHVAGAAMGGMVSMAGCPSGVVLGGTIGSFVDGPFGGGSDSDSV